MARLATTFDVFNALAEPARRDILSLLARGEQAVNVIVEKLRLTQPSVSKHLRVLATVRLVNVRQMGRQRVYAVNLEAGCGLGRAVRCVVGEATDRHQSRRRSQGSGQPRQTSARF
jgi:DNA-binding transcriptional ArsR family regulator